MTVAALVWILIMLICSILAKHLVMIQETFRHGARFSVFPEKEENTAVLFLKRKRPEIRAFIRKQFQAKTIPFIDIEIDRGEKNRQHIESLEKQIRDSDAEIGK